jgi:ABC-type dipeptide/oligopeptide/nickel transport system ATPase component
MRQRLTTGIAIASQPLVLIADEPTKGLDFAARRVTMEVFSELKRAYKTSILLITHDLDLAGLIGDRIGVMYSGEMVESGSARMSWPTLFTPILVALSITP